MSRVCAIHQPNLFPRWRTVDKLLAADVWVVLDDVQFCRRDYQHRARIGLARSPLAWQWLTIPVHLADGQATRIRDVLIADQVTAQRRIACLTRQYYRRAQGWNRIAGLVDEVATTAGHTVYLADVAERSVTAMLHALGWAGVVVRSSDIARGAQIRAGRSERLADLVLATGCTSCICGRGGLNYLDPAPFAHARITVSPVRAGQQAEDGFGRADLSGLATMAELGL